MEEASMQTAADLSGPKSKPAFEEVLDAIGTREKFQTRLNFIFNCLGGMFISMGVYEYHLAMQTPEHWCHVLGRQYTNYSLEEWKNMTIPKNGDSFSKCSMYNTSFGDLTSDRVVVPCQDGWDYDDRWFSLTVPSQMNWVCGDQYIVNDVMFYSQNLSVAISLLLGYIGDMFGRRPQYCLCLAIQVVSRLAVVLTPSVRVLFILAVSLMESVAGPMGESSMSVCLELTDIKHRITIDLTLFVGIALGMVAIGLTGWLLASWNYFFVFTAFCFLMLYIFFRWFPESPRWLACRGRVQEALAVLRRIAATNGRTVPPITLQVLHSVARAKTDRRGFLSIFSSWNLFKNTLLLIIARSVYLLSTVSVVLMVGSLSVNPFAAVVAQGAAKIPAHFMVLYCAARFGRRWSSVAAYLLTSTVAVVGVLVLAGGVQGAALTAVSVLIQFATTASGSVINLQSAEVHPTCLRQIAVSLEWAVAGATLSLVPYVVFLGSSVDRRLPFGILSALNILVAFFVSFLPESALQRLPETLEDAAQFGRRRHYWSWKPQPPTPYAAE